MTGGAKMRSLEQVFQLAAAMALVLVSCSNDSELDESDASSITAEVSKAPSPTLLMIEEEFAWSTDEPMPEGLDLTFPGLLPASAPAGDVASIEIRKFAAGTQPHVDITVRWSDDIELGPDGGLLTVQIERGAGVRPLDCASLSGAGWPPELIEETTVGDGVPDCAFTNEVGLYFLRWVDGVDLFLLSTRMPGDEARQYLATWKQF